MNIDSVIAILKLVDPRRKPLQRLGKFLCRDKIRLFESDRAALKARLEEHERELAELKGRHMAEHEELVSLKERVAVRGKFRRVAIGCASAYALRRSAAEDGEPPRLLCPVCFENGEIVELLAGSSLDCVAVNTFKKRTHVHCPMRGCGFRFITTPETFRQAFKLVD